MVFQQENLLLDFGSRVGLFRSRHARDGRPRMNELEPCPKTTPSRLVCQGRERLESSVSIAGSGRICPCRGLSARTRGASFVAGGQPRALLRTAEMSGCCACPPPAWIAPEPVEAGASSSAGSREHEHDLDTNLSACAQRTWIVESELTRLCESHAVHKEGRGKCGARRIHVKQPERRIRTGLKGAARIDGVGLHRRNQDDETGSARPSAPPEQNLLAIGSEGFYDAGAESAPECRYPLHCDLGRSICLAGRGGELARVYLFRCGHEPATIGRKHAGLPP